MDQRHQTKPRCFISLPLTDESNAVRRAIEKGVRNAGYELASHEDARWHRSMVDESLIAELSRADLMVADLTGRNPNVFFELGLAQAMGKGVFGIQSAESSNTPLDLYGYPIISYLPTRSGLVDLSKRLTNTLREFRDLPLVTRSFLAPRLPGFLSINWDDLDISDVENLCRELLAQLGYQRVEWETRGREIDLIAELPKRDPDGFEYKELWLVSMGLRAPVEMFLEIAAQDPEYLLHRIVRENSRVDKFLANGGSTTITLLIISIKDRVPSERFDMLATRTSHAASSGRYPGMLRLRVWDRAYLTTLVQQFPQLAYKYFSDEDRSRSKYRKSPEELYNENVRLLNRQSALLTQLEEEKNRRIRAERDAVWKNISFSAAHKFGNPLFAIETYLEPLQKRIVEHRTEEALGIVVNVRGTVERAKGIVDQFKSLARAQKINPVETKLYPILEEACRTASNSEISCRVDCDEDLTLVADPERLAECFDELISNATHWCHSPDREISIVVEAEPPPPLPEGLDTSKKYILIRMRDNGIGVPVENKSKMFNAFFTTRVHGTGLGLAVVRRIVEGHGGQIQEVGKPGHGAVFEIYLATVPPVDDRQVS